MGARSRAGQEAASLCEVDGLGSIAGSELLVEVLDVGLDRGAADAEVVADGGECAIGGQEGQDAGLGRR
jgi:hypothetical protein